MGCNKVSISKPREVVVGQSTVNRGTQAIDFAKVWSIAAGLGIVIGSFLGPVGALLGSIIGTGFGYWFQTSANRVEQELDPH